jgi:dUTPase
LLKFTIYNYTYKSQIFNIDLTAHLKPTFEIYENIQIPTGIGLVIPKGYHYNLRSKSSNFKNGFSVVEGLIDCNYTYGMGLQIVKFYDGFPIDKFYDGFPININEEQKIAQLEILKDTIVESIVFIPEKEYNQLAEVRERRNFRTGGFGSTGKK